MNDITINVKSALTNLRLFFITRDISTIVIDRKYIRAALAHMKITDINDEELDFLVDHI